MTESHFLNDLNDLDLNDLDLNDRFLLFSAVSIQHTLLHTLPVPPSSNRKSIEIIINQPLTLLLRKKVGVKACILPKNVLSLHRQSKEQPFVPRSGLLLRPARVINDGRRRSSMKPGESKLKRSARSLRSRSLRSLRSKGLLRVKVIKGHYHFQNPL